MHTYEKGVIITPALAKEMILAGEHMQRTIKPSMVRAFVDLMKSGKWKYPSGQCLIFNTDGIMCDGQNRCQAIVELGIPQKFDICRGVPTENMDAIDNGISRSHADLFVMKYKRNGIPTKYASSASSAMKYIVSWEQGNIYRCGAGVIPMITSETETRHRDIIESVKFIGNRQPWANKSVCISLHYLLSKNPIKKSAVDDFFNKFIDGTNLEKKDPAFVLRRMCEYQRRHKDQAKRPHEHIAWIIRTWEHHWAGKKISKISIGDRLPDLVI